MILGFGNNVTATLAADITSLQTTLPVNSGMGELFSKILTTDFQNSSVNHSIIAKITLCDREQTIWEICHLTAVNGDVLTVIRAQEGTTARGWTSGTIIGNFSTRGSENQLVQIGQLQGGDFVYAEALGTDNNLVVTIPSNATSNNWDLKSPIVISPAANNKGAVKIQLILGGIVIGIFPVFKANKKELVKNDIVSGIPFIVLLDKTKTFFTLINAGSLYELAQTTGQSTTIAMSQKSSTDELNNRLKTTGGTLTGNLIVPELYANNALYIGDDGNTKFQQDGDIIGKKWNGLLSAFLESSYGKKNTLSDKGWWKCGDTSLMIQWGEVSSPNKIWFPTAFSWRCFSITCGQYNTEGWITSPMFNNISKDGFTFYNNGRSPDGGSNQNVKDAVFYIAIGV